MGPNSYLLLLLRFQRVSLLQMEEKDILLMHAFLPCLLSFLFTSLFLSSLLLFFQFSLFFLPSFLPFPICGYCSYLYGVNLMGFFYFTPMVSPTFYGLRWTLLQSCPPTFRLPIHYHYLTCPVYSLYSTTCYMTNFPFVWSSYKPFSFVWMDKALGFFLTYLCGMYRVVLTIYHLFWAKCHHPTKHFL